MTSLRNILLITYLSAVFGFAPRVPSVQHQRTISSSCLFGGIATPGTVTKTTTVQKSKSVSKQKITDKVKVYQGEPDSEVEEAPLWMVFLIGDTGYTQNHVTNRLNQVFEDVNEEGAIAIYDAAQKVGEALCGKYDFELAELYAEQLTRSDPIIYAEIREDKQKED